MFSKAVCTPSHDKTSPISASIRSQCFVRSHGLRKSVEVTVLMREASWIFREKSVCAIDLEISAFLHKFPEGPELAKLVAKNDANLALASRFRQVPIESPL
ncbi:hypothetical protein TNCV_1220921 [Trichonephila clavipes]|nr:hypothetical protein TNCV_1220921 [Trichonephila clavipes]